MEYRPKRKPESPPATTMKEQETQEEFKVVESHKREASKSQKRVHFEPEEHPKAKSKSKVRKEPGEEDYLDPYIDAAEQEFEKARKAYEKAMKAK